MTHNYKRHGTTTLFAAFDVATGELLKDCMPKHRHQEFLKFMRQIEQSAPSDLSVHVVLDNYATHKRSAVKRWLELHPKGPVSLHSDIGVLAQSGRAFLQRTNRAQAPPSRSHQRR